MANFDVAFQWLISDEDAANLHSIEPDKCPKGCALTQCFAISGINSGAFPGEYDAIAALAQSERGLAVEQFYQAHFWNTWYAQLTSDEVAKRVFDASVNCGQRAAIEILQRAINSIALKMAAPGSYLLIIDGGWGPHTVESANALDPAGLVPAFCAERVLHYEAIVAANPEDAQYLAEWTARALK